MERILETPEPRKSSQKKVSRLLFPGESTWEWWSMPPSGPSSFKSATTPAEASTRSGNNSRAALPLRHVLVLPIWLATADNALMRDMIRLQLEQKGLTGTGREVSFNYRTIKQKDNRTLVIVSVLPETFPEEFCFSKIQEYRPATDYWPLPSNQLIVWKELGTLIFAFTLENNLIHVQNSNTGVIHSAFVQEAHCVRLVLESEDCLNVLFGITVFGSFSKSELAILSKLGLPLQVVERPHPVSPKDRWNLPPAKVSSEQKNRNKIQGARLFFATATVVYLLLLSVFIGHLVWLKWQKKSLAENLALERPKVAAIRSTFNRWEALGPAVQPEDYPLEMFFQCTQQLPERGVRLVTYEQNPTAITLTGEAQSASAAFQFAEALKKSPDLDGYTWVMPSPELQPNDSAKFVMEGRKHDATP